MKEKIILMSVFFGLLTASCYSISNFGAIQLDVNLISTSQINSNSNLDIESRAKVMQLSKGKVVQFEKRKGE